MNYGGEKVENQKDNKGNNNNSNGVETLRKTLATAMRRKEGQFVIGADHCVCVCECVGEIKM